MDTVVVVRSEMQERFTQVVEAGKHRFFADEPESVGGSGRGPSPYDFLLVALGS